MVNVVQERPHIWIIYLLICRWTKRKWHRSLALPHPIFSKTNSIKYTNKKICRLLTFEIGCWIRWARYVTCLNNLLTYKWTKRKWHRSLALPHPVFPNGTRSSSPPRTLARAGLQSLESLNLNLLLLKENFIRNDYPN